MAHGGVHESPGKAARGLIAWGIDLWPYVNGKALVKGLQLSAMDASDMLDVLHLFFEEDNYYSSEEELTSRSNIRTSLYENLYNLPYKYKYVPKKTGKNSPASDSYTPSETQNFDDLPDEEAIKPFNPRAERPKDYVPPTDFDGESSLPFGLDLDAPLGS